MKSSSIFVLTVLIVGVSLFTDCASSRKVKSPSKIRRLLDLLKKDQLTTPPTTCRPGYSKCLDTSSCIPDNYLCDGENDCENGSDESECGAKPCPLNRPVRCESTGLCLPAFFRCDGTAQCIDKSDELNCPPMTCRPGYFKCLNVSRCLIDDGLCDGVDDCGDESDEIGCGAKPCPPDRPIRCESTGVCMYASSRCDGYVQCNDKSDEINCPSVVCSPSSLKCQNVNKCVPRYLICNGNDDCGDGSDEYQCGSKREFEPDVGDNEVFTSEVLAAMIQPGADDTGVTGNGELPYDWDQDRKFESLRKMLRRRSGESRKALNDAPEKIAGQVV